MRWKLLGLLVVVIAAAACSSSNPSTTASTSAPPSTKPPPIRTFGPISLSVKSSSLGDILGATFVSATVYVNTKDTRDQSSCTGSCTQTWLPVTGQQPQAGTGTTASLIGTIRRGDGLTQVTYNGHALYRYAGDHHATDTKGQGVDGTWYVLSPSGEPVRSGP